MAKKSIPASKPAKTKPTELTPKDLDLQKDTVTPGPDLTTNQGLIMGDDQNSLKAGVRGPTLLEDFHFREKITHFDHERIPERVVHARGTAAHGYFEAHDSAADITKAGLFAEKGKRTPVFVRFSTVAGSRGSADTPRDVRGFAIKFYTDQGVWDLVGNNIPIFFIQDVIKFPDLIHAVKPEPNNEIPQAASAHDTFYDFVSLTPETTHMLMWVMSDRGLPRSLAMMEGFGIHTFRFINVQGKSVFVKFHFKPKKGVHSLVWDEAQKIAGKDADFNRRDLFESIERGDFPEWEMGVQIVEEKDEMKFDFDILDPTKLIPEELVPIRPLGKLVLNRNPDNYFAETEQVAFHPGHVVPGIDFSNDPLLQGRLFSYTDTQLKRVGPNFAQLPINRPTCPFSNNQRDGESQQQIHKGRVAYFPNSLAGGCPAHSPEGMAAFSSYAEKMDGRKVRERSPSFSDHFSQATLFWNSMANWEKAHIIAAFSFELNMVMTKEIRLRTVKNLLTNVHPDLANGVAQRIGLDFKAPPLPASAKGKKPLKSSPALSMDKLCDSIKGRQIAILAAPGADTKAIVAIKAGLVAQGALVEVIAKTAGAIPGNDGTLIPVDRPAPNAPSVVFDAVLIAPGKGVAEALASNPLAVQFIQEQYLHGKPIVAVGTENALLNKANIPMGITPHASDGLIFAKSGNDAVSELSTALKQHRFYARTMEINPT